MVRCDAKRPDLLRGRQHVRPWFSRIKPGTPNIQPSICATVRSADERSGLSKAPRLPFRSARESQAGLLVDERGNRFTPSHSNKNGRRYRYYDERAPIVGNRPSGAKFRRLPADEIENLVIDALLGLLASPTRLLRDLEQRDGTAASNDAIRAGRDLQRALTEASPAERKRSGKRGPIQCYTLRKDECRQNLMLKGVPGQLLIRR